jgi:hypothetical protein
MGVLYCAQGLNGSTVYTKCPGWQAPKGSKAGSKMTALFGKFHFMCYKMFKILRKITGNSIYNCQSLKFIISYRGANVTKLAPGSKMLVRPLLASQLLTTKPRI